MGIRTIKEAQNFWNCKSNRKFYRDLLSFGRVKQQEASWNSHANKSSEWIKEQLNTMRIKTVKRNL